MNYIKSVPSSSNSIYRTKNSGAFPSSRDIVQHICLLLGLINREPSTHVLHLKTVLIKRSGVNFINILWAAFTHSDPESTKSCLIWLSFFALLGSVWLKAARRTLMKLTPVVDFISVLTCNYFAQRSQKCKKTVKSSLEKKLANLFCCCISVDLRFTLCPQVWWNWPLLASVLLYLCAILLRDR